MSGTDTASPFLLPNTWVLTVPIDALSASGVAEPLPTDDVPSVTSSAAGLHAEIGTADGGTPTLLLNATVDGSQSTDVVYEIVLSDSAGLKPAHLFFSIVPDNTPTDLEARLVGATHTAQAVPPAG